MGAPVRAPEVATRRIPWELATPLQAMRAKLYNAEWRPERSDLVMDEGLDHGMIEAHAGVLVVSPAQFFSDGTFDLAPDGTLAAIVEVFAENDETVIDLVAWPLDRSDQFATAFGYAEGLGLARVRNPASYFGGHPLRVFRTPLAWLKAGCQGVVVLRETSAFLWLSSALGDLAAEDLAHAQRLARLLHSFFDPARIVVPRDQAA